MKKIHPSSDPSNKIDQLVYRVDITPQVMKYMGIGERFYSVKFDTIQCGDHVEYLRRYYNRIYTACRDGWGLVLTGRNGVGKTGAAIVMLKQARRVGFTGLFISTSFYLSSIIDKRLFYESQTVQDRAENVDMLVLDDFGKESIKTGDGAWGGRSIEDLLRFRNLNRRSTIITTNGKLEIWGAFFGKSFVSLIDETFLGITMIGKDLRV